MTYKQHLNGLVQIVLWKMQTDFRSYHKVLRLEKSYTVELGIRNHYHNVGVLVGEEIKIH